MRASLAHVHVGAAGLRATPRPNGARGTVFSCLSESSLARARMIRLVLTACVLAALVVPARAGGDTAGDRVDLRRVSFDQSTDGSSLVARMHTSARVRAYSVDQDGGTVELVLYRARLAPSLERAAARMPVRSYRTEAGGDRVTVRFEIDPSVNVRAYPDRESADLLLSFSAAPRPRAMAWGGGRARRPVRPIEPAPVAAIPTPTASDAVLPAPPQSGALQADLSSSAAHWRLDTIVLDAGHGGRDAGGVGIGTTDRDVAFAVVRRLGPMIERELGVKVVYTRSTDTFVELRERGRIANRSGGKLFISVHGNAGPASARGTETFFLAPRGSASARDVMERENSVIQLESDPSFYDGYTSGGDILASLAMSAYQEESQHLARLIEGEFQASGRHSRGVKQNNFAVLWGASMPAVLVEVGFVTNPDEARFLSSSDGPGADGAVDLQRHPGLQADLRARPATWRARRANVRLVSGSRWLDPIATPSAVLDRSPTAHVVSVLASARRDGHTARLLDAVLAGRPGRRFDLGALRVEGYDYGAEADDDFLVVANAVAEADAVVFATPVYWYAMSGPLKQFFDRLTDLVTVRKSLGRRLSGRTVWVVACGSAPALPEGFEVPFWATAAYFGMSYGGALYVPMQEGQPLSPRSRPSRRAERRRSEPPCSPGPRDPRRACWRRPPAGRSALER